MKNELFYYLKRSNIFKDNGRYSFDGLSRILASEKTEQRRKERNRLRGRPYSKKEWDNIQKQLTERRKSKLSGETSVQKEEKVNPKYT